MSLLNIRKALVNATFTCVLFFQNTCYLLLFINQELECAVSVEEDNRQEWTFTLYDFDNNGKVTREVRRQRPLLSTNLGREKLANRTL